MSSSCDTFDKCHLDSLKLVKKPLPLPPPQDKMWMATQHVIDDLHIKNHKRESCHERFNPQKVKDVVPEANLMCAEQTFTWQSRYKKVLNSMTKTHFHFVLHQLVKGRNRYTSRCYKENRKPLLPSAKISKKKYNYAEPYLD